MEPLSFRSAVLLPLVSPSRQDRLAILEKKLTDPQLIWHEGIGSLLLLAAAQQTGLLDAFVTAVMEVADPTIPGLSPPNPAVVARLLLTLLFLPVAGLARTWDLRSYTGTMWLCCKKDDAVVSSASLQEHQRSFFHEPAEPVQMASL